MFISKEAAEARLRGGRNLFREQNSVRDTQDAPALPSESQTLNEEEDHAIDDTQEEQPSQAGAEADEVDVISLPHLDDLLQPRVNGRANYKGKIESQAAIGETNLILGKTQTSRVFGLSMAQTSAYGYGQPDVKRSEESGREIKQNPELKRRLIETKSRLAQKAADRLDLTLEQLTVGKLAGIKRATNIAKVAKDLAIIMEKCSDVEKHDAQTVHFHVYQPEMNVEQNYQTVNVGPTLPSHSD